jgi:branched-subunit amino acid ABC-type transport system permease component
MRQGGHEEPLVVSGGCAAMLDFVQQLVSGVALGCVYGLIALGFVLVYKATEVVNFAQGDLMMLGGFFAFTFIGMMGLNYWIGFAGAVAAMALFGIGRTTTRSGSTPRSARACCGSARWCSPMTSSR